MSSFFVGVGGVRCRVLGSSCHVEIYSGIRILGVECLKVFWLGNGTVMLGTTAHQGPVTVGTVGILHKKEMQIERLQRTWNRRLEYGLITGFACSAGSSSSDFLAYVASTILLPL